MGNSPPTHNPYADLDRPDLPMCGCGPEEVLTNINSTPNTTSGVDQQQRISTEKRIVAALRSGNFDRIKNVLARRSIQKMNTLDFLFPVTDLVICTPMHYAARFLPLECVQVLGDAILEAREKEVKRKYSEGRDQDGMTPLHYAVLRAGTVFDCSESIHDQSQEVQDAFEVVKYLASSGVCDPNSQDLVSFSVGNLD
jgi:hypothetical protein